MNYESYSSDKKKLEQITRYSFMLTIGITICSALYLTFEFGRYYGRNQILKEIQKSQDKNQGFQNTERNNKGLEKILKNQQESKKEK